MKINVNLNGNKKRKELQAFGTRSPKVRVGMTRKRLAAFIECSIGWNPNLVPC